MAPRITADENGMQDLIPPDARARFAEQGWLVVGPLLDLVELEALRAALEARLRIFAAEIDTPFDEYVSVVSQWTNLWEHDPVFRRQLHHPDVARIAATLLGCERVRVFHDHVIAKPPRGGSTIPWHRDLPNWPIAAPRVLSCWLALDDVTAEAGAMRFMPGGHEQPITSSIDFLNTSVSWGSREAEVVTVEVPAGWAIFHHCLTWHTSPPNRSDQWRRAYITICMDAESTFDRDRAPWHPMTSRVRAAPGEVFDDDVFPVLGAETSKR